ncbi:hypothetical protein THAOC_14348, partial [Thalassiosira oceanica]
RVIRARIGGGRVLVPDLQQRLGGRRDGGATREALVDHDAASAHRAVDSAHRLAAVGRRTLPRRLRADVRGTIASETRPVSVAELASNWPRPAPPPDGAPPQSPPRLVSSRAQSLTSLATIDEPDAVRPVPYHGSAPPPGAKAQRSSRLHPGLERPSRRNCCLRGSVAVAMGLSSATGALATSAGFVAQASRDDQERTHRHQAGRLGQPLHELGRPQVAVTSRVGSAAVASRVGCAARGARPSSPRGRTPERQLLTPAVGRSTLGLSDARGHAVPRLHLRGSARSRGAPGLHLWRAAAAGRRATWIPPLPIAFPRRFR